MKNVITLLSIFAEIIALNKASLLAVKKDTKKDSSATLIFVGDISFDGPVKYFAEQKKTCNYSDSFAKVKKLLKDADLRIGNLESPLLPPDFHGEPAFEGKSVHNMGSIMATAALKSAGFDIMTLSNNHIVDYGTKGVESTIRALKKEGIDYVGVRDRLKKRQKPLIKTVNGVKLGFLAYCFNKEGCEIFEQNSKHKDFTNIFRLGPSVYSNAKGAKDIKHLRRKVDFIIVLMHWSKELSLIPPRGIRDMARAMSIHGANLIIGSHPHVIQGHECTSSSTLTAYSLGNFIFGRNGVDFTKFMAGRTATDDDVEMYIKQMKEVYSPTQLGFMFRVTVTKKGIVSSGYIPVEIINEPRGNCLQPTPKTQKWQSTCIQKDLYCLDFTDVYSSGQPNLNEHLDGISAKVNVCINRVGD